MTTRVAFITGASSGIGHATALAMARAGIHVVGLARREDRLNALATTITALPAPHGEFVGVRGDVTRAADVDNAVQTALQRFGRLDILVANAGVGHRGAIATADWEDLSLLLRTNIEGVLHSVRAAVPAMRQSGGGHIITISSVAYNLVAPYAAAYSASKAFVTSLAHSLRGELSEENIWVTDVLVGRTHTEFNEKRLGAGKRTGAGIPTMSAEHVAAAIVKTLGRRDKTVYPRLFDRLLVWGNKFIPSIMGELAKRQYR